MPRSLYQADPGDTLSRGAIYRYRPIFWLGEPPLWILRDIQWESPARAYLYRRSSLHNAFRTGERDNQEFVMATAKVRFVIVISPNYEIRLNLKDVLVAPTYTFHADRPDFAEFIRNDESPWCFYLAEDAEYPDMKECFINLRNTQALHRDFLTEGKLDYKLSDFGVKAVLQKYKEYLSSNAR